MSSAEVGMKWVPGGEFAMGSEDFYPEERPVRRVAVEGFWIDEHPVTVAEFRRFVKYRPAVRQFEAVDTSTGHLGFRCVARSG
jgi:formylglycine-generating enzyme required for sulfatase activity